MEKGMAERLIAWYRERHRVLPWREDPSPYHVWLSEIMLQQTRVEAVKAYYLRFLDKLPTIADLANAEEDVYLKLWEGLGYYSRVKNLHRCAVEVMARYGGELPSSKEELLSLPGIGPYTASAISSIAFHQKEVAVDGNLLRIYARVAALPLDPKSPKALREVEAGWKAAMAGDPALFNQALMELGQTLCIPHGSPRCGDCPLRECCLAHRQKKEADYPLAAKKTKQRVEEKTVFVLTRAGGIAMEKRPAKGLLASLYQLPNAEGILSLEEAKAYLEGLGYEVLSLADLGHARHEFSHRIWEMQGYRAEVKEGPGKFVSREELSSSFSLPTAFSYFL